MSTSTAFQPLTLSELFALDLPAPEFAVEGILPLGAATLLDAREKSGKGLLTIDLCASVALGEPFLDRAVLEGPAIYCAAEENVRDVRYRIEQRVGSERSAPLLVLPLNGVPIRDGESADALSLHDILLMQRLWDMVEEVKPVVVVLDTLRELHVAKEDSADDMAPLLKPLRQLAHQQNIALIVNHHQNRGGTFRGSTAILGAFDQEWSFTRTDEESSTIPRGSLRVKGRYGEQRLSIGLGDGLRWSLATPSVTIAPVGLDDRILTTLAEAPDWLTSEDIHRRIGGELALKSVQNVLSEMNKRQPRPFAVEAMSGRGRMRHYRTLQHRLDDG